MTQYKATRFAAVLMAAASLAGAASADAGGYQMTEADMKLSCKQLSGRIQVRLLQVRDFSERPNPSQLSRSLESAFAKAPGVREGIDPDARNAKDLQMLVAFNQRLAEKGCKSYDLEKELGNRDPNELPAATVPSPKAKNAKR